jgi:hypothetical protein
MFMILVDPALKDLHRGQGTDPFLKPEALFCERARPAFGGGIPLWVVIAGQGLLDLQRATRVLKGHGGGLTAVVTHEGDALASYPVGELAAHGHVQSCHSLLRGAPDANVGTHNDCGKSVEDYDNRDPAEAVDQDLGHINTPPLIGFVGPRFAAARRPLGLQLQVRGHQEAMFPHQAPRPHRPWGAVP